MANPEHVEYVKITDSVHAPTDLRVTQLDCTGGDFSGCDLRGRNFQHSDLQGANFRNAKLQNTHFYDCNLEGADLTNADCTEAQFQRAILINAKVEGTKFCSANLNGAKLTGVQIQLSTLEGASLRDITFDEHVNFRDRELSGVSFDNSSLKSACFSHSTLRKTSFDNANLDSAIFEDALLSECGFNRAKLLYTSLRGGNFNGTRFAGCDFTGTDLTSANLSNCTLTSNNFEGVDFYDCDFAYAVVTNCNFRAARNLPTSRNLTKISTHPDGPHNRRNQNIEHCEMNWLTRLDWGTIRAFGRLPIFSASATALIAFPVLFYFIDTYNKHVDSLNCALSSNAANQDSVIAEISKLPPLPIPSWSLVSLISATLLFFASAIYMLRCPDRIKGADKTQWCDEYGKSLLEYLPHAWLHPRSRAICITLYLSGGLLAALVIVLKFLKTFLYVLNATEFSPLW